MDELQFKISDPQNIILRDSCLIMSNEFNEGVIDDLIKKRVDRISKLFPPLVLAYSFLLKADNHQLSLDELYEDIMQFPQVPDARKIFLSPDDTKLFDFQDVNLFQISLNKFISFDKEELVEILDNPYFNVLSSNGIPNEVCLTHPPEIDVNRTLLIFRHLYPQMTETDIFNEIDKPLFIAYFHYHRLEFDQEDIQIPELQPPESFYYFDKRPTPEDALLSIFCANRTDKMRLIDILQLKRNTEIYVGRDKNPENMNTTIDDIFSLVEESHIFYFVDDTIQVYPPIILSKYFNYYADFSYRPNPNPCLIYSPDDDDQTNDDKSISNDPSINSLYLYIERILEDIGDDVPNFTFSQIFEHVIAQLVGCDHFIFGEEIASMHDIGDAIIKWISEHTENGVISRIQGFENDNHELLEQRRGSLTTDRTNDDIMDQMLDQYSFLKQDSEELEEFYSEIRQKFTDLYKLKGT